MFSIFLTVFTNDEKFIQFIEYLIFSILSLYHKWWNKYRLLCSTLSPTPRWFMKHVSESSSHLIIVVFVKHVLEDVVRSFHSRFQLVIQLIAHLWVAARFIHCKDTITPKQIGCHVGFGFCFMFWISCLLFCNLSCIVCVLLPLPSCSLALCTVCVMLWLVVASHVFCSHSSLVPCMYLTLRVCYVVCLLLS